MREEKKKKTFKFFISCPAVTVKLSGETGLYFWLLAPANVVQIAINALAISMFFVSVRAPQRDAFGAELGE